MLCSLAHTLPVENNPTARLLVKVVPNSFVLALEGSAAAVEASSGQRMFGTSSVTDHLGLDNPFGTFSKLYVFSRYSVHFLSTCRFLCISGLHRLDRICRFLCISGLHRLFYLFFPSLTGQVILRCDMMYGCGPLCFLSSPKLNGVHTFTLLSSEPAVAKLPPSSSRRALTWF